MSNGPQYRPIDAQFAAVMRDFHPAVHLRERDLSDLDRGATLAEQMRVLSRIRQQVDASFPAMDEADRARIVKKIAYGGAA